MDCLDTSTNTLSENPTRPTNPSSLWVNTTSKYLYQNHNLPAKYSSASQNLFNKTKELSRSQSSEAELTRTPTSRSSQTSLHATIALSFNNKDLNSVPKAVTSHTNSLLILDLSSNHFNEFPQEILAISKLKSLKMDSNRLKKIPNEISKLSHLESLSLASNYITALPSTIGQLSKSLTTLNLSFNRIENLPIDLCELTKLKVLWIQNNAFTALPVQLDRLTYLRELGLEWFKYTLPVLATIQNDKRVDSIAKLFALCKRTFDSHKIEIEFEAFIQDFSSSAHDILSIRDPLQRNLLHIAALEQEIGIVRYLTVKRRELIDLTDQNNQTPLSLAIREEKDLAAKTLILNKANPNIGIGPLGSALHIATARQRVGLVKDLLKYNAKPDQYDAEGNTPLHVLCSIFSKSLISSREIAIMLMGSGADPNLPNNDGWTPLHLAIRRGQIDCLKWAIEYNRKNEDNGKKLFDLTVKGGSDKWTLLHLAAGLGHYEILNILVENKVDLLARTKTGKTARDVAVNNMLIFKILKKLEDQYISESLNHKLPSLESKLKEFSASSSVFNLKHMIHSNSNKVISAGKTSTVTDARDTKATEEDCERKIPLTHTTKVRHAGVGAKTKGGIRPIKAQHLVLGETQRDNPFEESSVQIGDVDEVAETKEVTRTMPRSPNNIQKIQIAQNYRDHMLRSSVNRDSSTNIHGTQESTSSRMNRSHKSGPLSFILNQNASTKSIKPQPQNFIFPTDFNRFIKNFESYIEEIKGFQDLLLKESEISLSEKLKHLFYMQVLHMKINGKLKKMTSELIPMELFILCEHIDDELRKGKEHSRKGSIKHNYDIIPRTLLFVFENLDSRRSLKNAFVKTRISYLFGEFKYDSAKHFLSQLVTNPQERTWLKLQARLSWNLINKDLAFVMNNYTLNPDNLFKERHLHLASVLVSPKHDFSGSGHQSVSRNFHQNNHMNSNNLGGKSTLPPKPNKRALSYVPPSSTIKCENIEEDEDNNGVHKQQRNLKASFHLEKSEALPGHSRMGSGVRMIQGPLASKADFMQSKESTLNIQNNNNVDVRSKNIDIRGASKKIGVENYFSQM